MLDIDYKSNQSPNNGFMNSILHIFIRIKLIKKMLKNCIENERDKKSEIYNELIKIFETAFKNSKKDSADLEINEKYEIDMTKFRRCLGSAYPHTFPLGESCDSSSFLNFLINFFTDEVNISKDYSINIDKVFKIKLIVDQLGEFTENEISTTTINNLIFSVYKAIPTIEMLEKRIHRNFTITISNRFEDLFNATNKCSIDEGKAILAACTGKDFQPNIEYKLSSECPKIISFVFEYRSYFNNIGEDSMYDDETFITRSVFSRILPETLDFSKIVNTKRLNESIMSFKVALEKEETKGNEEFKLFAILGYYDHHYMSFVRGENSEGEQNYFLCEDAKIKRIGSFDALMKYLEKSKVIPYIVFYELIEPKKTQTKKFIKKNNMICKNKKQREETKESREVDYINPKDQNRLHTSSTSKFLYEEIELKKEQKEEQKKVLKKEQKRAEEKHIIEKSRSTSNKPKKENKIEVRLNIYLKFNSCVMMLPREINKVLKHTDTKYGQNPSTLKQLASQSAQKNSNKVNKISLEDNNKCKDNFKPKISVLGGPDVDEMIKNFNKDSSETSQNNKIK